MTRRESASGPVAWRVVAGGVPTAAEIAAVTIALTPVAVAGEQGDEQLGGRGPRLSNWRYAAIVEGVGGRPPSSLQDVEQGRFGLGTVGDPLRRR